MTIYNKLYIGGRWVSAESQQTIDVVNPANGDLVASVPAAGEKRWMPPYRLPSRPFPHGVPHQRQNALALYTKFVT